MTDEERQKFYLDNNGMLCPFCHSDNIDQIDDIYIEEELSWQRVCCNTCDKEWTDEYKLTGFTADENLLEEL